MSKIDDGGPAFPFVEDPRPDCFDVAPGMSLRDWFAGQALAGFLGDQKNRGIAPITFAAAAYVCADAMLICRTQTLAENEATVIESGRL